MKPFIRAFFITAFTTISVVAQQDTNLPPADFQSSGVEVADRPDEDRIAFLLDVASAYLRDNDPSSAITAYERIFEIDPMHQEARYLSSTLYIAVKQYAKAERLLKSLIEERPEGYRLMNNLAWLYATAEDPAFRDAQKAIELAQDAMVLAPNDYQVWSTLAEAYYSSGQYEKANRAVTQMAALGMRYGSNFSQEQIVSYREQVRKCRRALDTEKALQGDEEESPLPPGSVDEDAQ